MSQGDDQKRRQQRGGLSMKSSFLDLVLIVTYIGGAVHVSRQPGYGFWDGVIWVYYLGRYIATHFTL